MATINSVNNRSETFTVTAGGLTVTAGGLTVTAGGLTVTAGGLTVTAGAITATSGDVVITSGNLTLPTTSSTVGQIQINAKPFVHSYGTLNTFIGEEAGNFTFNTTYNKWNVGIGYHALASLVGAGTSEGVFNVACGYEAGAGLTTGYKTLHLGYKAGFSATTGQMNSFVGYASNNSGLTTGSYCTFLGANTGNNYTSDESSNILIGYSILGTAGEDNVLRIGISTGTGNGEIAKSFIAGIRGTTTDAADAVAVLISSTGQLGTTSSSIRYKENIKDMGSASSGLMDMRPVTFNYKTDESKKMTYGLIAEEVAQICPEIVVNDKDGVPETIQYHLLPAMLLNEIQKLNKRVCELEALVSSVDKFLKGG